MGTTANAWSESIALDRARLGLIAAGAFRRRRAAWNPLLHPRGANGRFIEKGGRVKWRDKDSAQLWRVGDVIDITAKGQVKVRDTDGNVAIRDPKTLYTVPKPKARINPNSWKKVGVQAGSNPGGFFEDQNKEQWYVKNMSQDRVSNEVAATRLYELAGATVPEVTSSPDGKKFVTKIEDSDEFSDISAADRDDALEAVAKDFTIDAWLANWDAPHNDNIRFNEMGDAMRVDTGGSLDYRAKGEKKGSLFGPVVGELKTMKEFRGRPNRVYAKVTRQHEEDGARRILAIHPDEIRETIKENGLPSTVADTLIARRAYIANHYGFSLPETTPEGQALLAKAAANAGDSSASSVATTSAPSAAVAPKAGVSAQRPSMLSAVKKTDPNTMPFAPNSPVWLKAKLDEGKGQGDIWTIKTIAADKSSLDIESHKTKKVITVKPDDVQILRSNLTTGKAFYSDGKTVPEVGDAVQTPAHGNGKIESLFHNYSKVRLDDGSARINAIGRLTKIDSDDTTADAVDATTDGAAPAAPAAPKKPRAKKSAIPGDEFDVENHDWDKDPNPKLYDMVHGRETQAVMVTKTPAGKINGIVVSMDDTLGETAIIAPNKARVSGSLTDDDYQNWVSGVASTPGQKVKAPTQPAYIRRQEAIDNMDEKAARALKPKPISSTLYRAIPRNGQKSTASDQVDDDNKEYYTLKPGDELFQATAVRKKSEKHTFLRRDGKMHYLGGSTAVANNYTLLSNNTPATDATELWHQTVGSTRNYYDGFTVSNITPPEFSKAANVLKTEGTPKELEENVGKYKADDGKHYSPTEIFGENTDAVNTQPHPTLEFNLYNNPQRDTSRDNDPELRAKMTALNADLQPSFMVKKYRDDQGAETGKFDVFVVGYTQSAGYISYDGKPKPKPEVLAPDKVIKLSDAQKQFYFTSTKRFSSTYDINFRTFNDPADSDKSLPDDEYLTTKSGTKLDTETMKFSGSAYGRNGDTPANRIMDSLYGVMDAKMRKKNPHMPMRWSSKQATTAYNGYPLGSREVPIPNAGGGGAPAKRDDVIANIDVSALKPGEKVPGFGSVWTERKLTPMEGYTGKIDSKMGDLASGKFDDIVFRTAMRDTFGSSLAMVADDGSTQKDPAMYEFTRFLHGDAVPLKLPPRAFKQYMDANEVPRLYRGIDDDNFQRDFRYGTFYQGYGVFGNGTYTTNVKATALNYARHNRNGTRGAKGGGVTNVTIKKGARIVEQSDVLKSMNKMIGSTSDDILKDLSDQNLLPTKAELEKIGNDKSSPIDPELQQSSSFSYRGVLSPAVTEAQNKTLRQATAIKSHLKSQGLEVTSAEIDQAYRSSMTNVKMIIHNKNLGDTPGDNNTFRLSLGNIDIFRKGPDEDLNSNLVIGFEHKPSKEERRRTQFHNNMEVATTPITGVDPVRSTRALAIMKGVDIGNTTPEYFDDNGNLVKNEQEFNENKKRLSDLHMKYNSNNTYWGDSDGDRNPVAPYDPQKSFYSGEVQRFYSENLPTMKKIARLQFGSENGRFAAANGIDVIQLGRHGSEMYRVFTNRNAIVMEKNW